MRKFLLAINLFLALSILFALFYWHPAPDEIPLPGTHAARVGTDAPSQ